MKLFLSCKYMFVEYEQIFILNFCFMAQIQGTFFNIFKKIKKKKWRAFEKFIEKMASFSAVFWVNKILNLYFLA